MVTVAIKRCYDPEVSKNIRKGISNRRNAVVVALCFSLLPLLITTVLRLAQKRLMKILITSGIIK